MSKRNTDTFDELLDSNGGQCSNAIDKSCADGDDDGDIATSTDFIGFTESTRARSAGAKLDDINLTFYQQKDRKSENEMSTGYTALTEYTTGVDIECNDNQPICDQKENGKGETFAFDERLEQTGSDGSQCSVNSDMDKIFEENDDDRDTYTAPKYQEQSASSVYRDLDVAFQSCTKEENDSDPEVVQTQLNQTEVNKRTKEPTMEQNLSRKICESSWETHALRQEDNMYEDSWAVARKCAPNNTIQISENTPQNKLSGEIQQVPFNQTETDKSINKDNNEPNCLQKLGLNLEETNIQQKEKDDNNGSRYKEEYDIKQTDSETFLKDTPDNKLFSTGDIQQVRFNQTEAGKSIINENNEPNCPQKIGVNSEETHTLFQEQDDNTGSRCKDENYMKHKDSSQTFLKDTPDNKFEEVKLAPLDQTEIYNSIINNNDEQNCSQKPIVTSDDTHALQQEKSDNIASSFTEESDIRHTYSSQTLLKDTSENNIEGVPLNQAEIYKSITNDNNEQNCSQNLVVNSEKTDAMYQEKDGNNASRCTGESDIRYKDSSRTFPKDKSENNIETGKHDLTEVSPNDSNQATLSEHPSDFADEADEHLSILIQKFGLNSFYPEKITLIDVIEICQDPISPRYTDIPWIVLRNLLMVNFNARDKIDVLEENEEEDNQQDHYDEIWDELGIEEHHDNVNPLDLLVMLFLCSSPTLKSILASKLFMCKLAIPLIIPWRGSLVSFPSILHSIVIDEKMPHKCTKQTFASDILCHIVSFVRIGKLEVSKSQWINSLLSDPVLGIFFNKNCHLGTTDKTASEGLVEAAWFIPSGNTKKESMSDNTSLCLNLRGDCEKHLNQFNLLSKLSSVVVIFLELNALVQSPTFLDFMKTINSLQQASRGIVLVIDSSNHNKQSIAKIYRDFCDKHATIKPYIKWCTINKEKQCSADTKKRLMNHIHELLKQQQCVSLSENLRTGVCQNVIMDKDGYSYKEAQENATELLGLIPNCCENAKDDITPLQGNAWEEWTKNMKITHKSSKITDLKERDKYIKEMNRQRQNQLQLCRKRHPFMQKCIQQLFQNIEDDSKFTCLVQWIKSLLENRTNRLTFNHLMEYQSLRQQLSKAKDENKPNKILEKIEKNVNDSRDVLNNLPFQLEHIVRECGQTFESMMANESKLTADELAMCKELPKIGAKLLLTGHPLEIMDGDVANVPMVWVKSVLDTLVELVGERKLLALSVVGVQSSGKSTLLNTMFGLQFSTSVGRCTKGVFMQLIPVRQRQKNHFPFDYICVIDTEGLRAPDIVIDQPLTHDNKLATFVIGLSDIAIVNVKGESTSEVKDILQMVVHAFLRLKVVNKRFNLKQSCIFVHQNVPAADADSTTMAERYLFTETLDKMAIDAAEQENIADIKTFKQVIYFDCEKDVNYFSDLWLGVPPMVPVNPGYSEKAATVKDSIVYRTANNRKTYFTITDTKTRIEDLWNGILNDDFVYSFRNTLELKAYNLIERQYHSYVWQLEKTTREFKLSDARNALSAQINIEEMETAIPKIMNSLSQKLDNKVTELKRQLTLFIEGNPLQGIMVQWEESKLKRLQDVSDDLMYQAQSEINTLQEEIRIDKFRNDEKRKHEKACNEMARELAYKMEGEEPSEEDMWKNFESMWISWLNRLNVRHINKEEDNLVKEQIENLIRTMFNSLLVYMNLDGVDQERYKKMNRLEDSISVNNILEEHISIKTSIEENVEDPGEHHAYMKQAVVVTNMILRRIDQKIDEVSCQDVKFDITYAKEVFQLVESTTDEHNGDNSKRYTLTSTYMAMIVGHVAFYITCKFKSLDDRYKRKHSVKGQLEDHKMTVWTYFKSLVEKQTEDMITIGFFKEITIKAVIEHVLRLLPIDVQETIYYHFLKEKYQVMKAIMIDLADKHDFNDIMAYVKDPAGYATKWMKEFVFTYIFESEALNGNVFLDFAKRRIDKIFLEIEKKISAVSYGNDENVAASDWIDAFIGDPNQTFLSKDMYCHVSDRNISDICNFTQTLIKELNVMKQGSMAYFNTLNRHNIQWQIDPIKSLMGKIWGCEDKCMFCKEPCKNTDKRHVEFGFPHSCIQHRPQGIGGFRYDYKNMLAVEFCNALIQGEATQYQIGSRDEYRFYKDYKEQFPDWNIQPTYDTSKYWMWVLCEFQESFTDFYYASPPDIPSQWLNITKEEAINEL